MIEAEKKANIRIDHEFEWIWSCDLVKEFARGRWSANCTNIKLVSILMEYHLGMLRG